MIKQQIKVTRTDNGHYTFEFGSIVLRVHRRGARGWAFSNAPSPLLGVFSNIDLAKQAFSRYVDAEEIKNNPLIDDDVDRSKGTVLDPALRFGPPPRRRPDPMTTEEAEAHLKEKLGH